MHYSFFRQFEIFWSRMNKLLWQMNDLEIQTVTSTLFSQLNHFIRHKFINFKDRKWFIWIKKLSKEYPECEKFTELLQYTFTISVNRILFIWISILFCNIEHSSNSHILCANHQYLFFFFFSKKKCDSLIYLPSALVAWIVTNTINMVEITIIFSKQVILSCFVISFVK